MCFIGDIACTGTPMWFQAWSRTSAMLLGRWFIFADQIATSGAVMRLQASMGTLLLGTSGSAGSAMWPKAVTRLATSSIGWCLSAAGLLLVHNCVPLDGVLLFWLIQITQAFTPALVPPSIKAMDFGLRNGWARWHYICFGRGHDELLRLVCPKSSNIHR